jgi:hypothetical protein
MDIELVALLLLFCHHYVSLGACAVISRTSLSLPGIARS